MVVLAVSVGVKRSVETNGRVVAGWPKLVVGAPGDVVDAG